MKVKRQNSRKERDSIKHFDFILQDFIIVEVSFFLAVLWYYLSFEKPLFFPYYYRQQSISLFACLMVSLAVNQPYKGILKRDKWMELSAVIKHTFFLAVFDLVLLFITKDTDATSRLTFVATWTIYCCLEFISRCALKKFIRNYILKKRAAKRQIVVLAKRERATILEKNLEYYYLRDYDVAGVFLTDYNREGDENTIIIHTNVLGGTSDLIDYAVHNWVDEVIIDSSVDEKTNNEISNELSDMGIITHRTVAVFPENEDSSSEEASYVEKIGNCIVITHKPREIMPLQVFFKRVLDLIGGLIGSFFAIIIIIIVGPIIKKKSPGPIIFAQERVGKNGKTFKMYKIRSMYMDAEKRKAELMSQNKMDGFMFKIDDDPRIIGSEKKDKDGRPNGIGNFIRRTSLDEFPQFFNVVKGDMSLVGTRPPTIDEWNKYTPQHRKRLSIKPGITGLWQISGRSDITDFNDVVKLDSEYIDTWTVGTDFKILLKTVAKVLKKEGAE